jgi:streptomycin 6-kinase
MGSERTQPAPEAGDSSLPHPGLAWARSSAEGRAWLARLPSLLAECRAEWSLEVGKPFSDAYASLALPATLPGGREGVLKLCFPHRESEHEAAALARWDGNGAVRLYAHDPERWALLIERCRPGTQLSALGQEAALDVMVELLPRLWVPVAEPFRTLEEEARWWASYLSDRWEDAGRPFEQALFDAALEALTALPPTQGRPVLLHQDLHPMNVLQAEREPWLVIDPKPLLGEREFGVAPLVRALELGHSERHVRRRLDRLTAELDLDRERARLWSLAQTIAWCFGSDWFEQHVETARWLARA